MYVQSHVFVGLRGPSIDAYLQVPFSSGSEPAEHLSAPSQKRLAHGSRGFETVSFNEFNLYNGPRYLSACPDVLRGALF